MMRQIIFSAIVAMLIAFIVMLMNSHTARASTTITVTRSDDGTNCGPQPTGETLRCAINDTNAMGTFNTIQFASNVTHVMLASSLPIITSQGTAINGALPNNGIEIIDAAAIFGNVLQINASDVLIFDFSIINTPSNSAD